MPWDVDHGLSLIHMSVSNFSHFRHLRQNCIYDGRHGVHLESLQLLSGPEQFRMGQKLGGRHRGSMEI